MYGLGTGPGALATAPRVKGLGNGTPNTFMRLSFTEYSILKYTKKHASLVNLYHLYIYLLLHYPCNGACINDHDW